MHRRNVFGPARAATTTAKKIASAMVKHEQSFADTLDICAASITVSDTGFLWAELEKSPFIQ
jgi:hypothetical protein